MTDLCMVCVEGPTKTSHHLLCISIRYAHVYYFGHSCANEPGKKKSNFSNIHYLSGKTFSMDWLVAVIKRPLLNT